MTSIKESGFWVGLLRKIVKIIFKNAGLSTGPRSHNQHVVPHEEGWAVRGEGNEKVTAIYATQKKALKRAKEIAENYNSSIIIHRKDGTIRDRINYD